MSSIRSFFTIKTLLILLGIAVIFMFGRSTGLGGSTQFISGRSVLMNKSSSFGGVGSQGVSSPMMAEMSDAYAPAPAPSSGGISRMVVRDTSLSIVVINVAEAMRVVEKGAKAFGGYMVDSQLSQPEGAAHGSITVRVPSEKRTEALAVIKSAGIKTTQETVSGQDITDQYSDVAAHLDVLNKTKEKFEKIMDGATQVQDLLQVQRELISLQNQIDSLRGQQKYLEQSSQMTKITAFLSTDEYSLPFTPDQPWRAEVVFKTAVRSMVGTFRTVANMAIWIAVYAPLWLPIGIVIFIIRRKNAQKKSTKVVH